MRRKYPFRIGATSYTYPGNILSNVYKLKDQVDDIELVLFETDSIENIPKPKDLKELKHISDKWNLTYTAHLPLGIDSGSVAADKKKDPVKKIGKLIERLSVLNPYAYILHLNLSEQSDVDIKLWQNRINQSLKKIIKLQLVRPQGIAIENLSYPFSYIDTLISKNGFSICVDITIFPFQLTFS